MKTFGSNYETRDGTEAHDYIHIVDLADAHIKTLYCQTNLKLFEVLNTGNGKGITVLKLIDNFHH